MSGRFEDTRHLLDVRVYYEDTDFSGFVYHANYLKFAERGRSDFLRLAGVHHGELLRHDPQLAFVVGRMCIDFLAPAKIDDLLRVETMFTQVRGARLFAKQQILRDTQCLWQAQVLAACIDLNGKPRRMPASVRARLAARCADTEEN